ncbi:MAG: hypothetical protein ACJ77A_16945 [Actinomycetota bacterium]
MSGPCGWATRAIEENKGDRFGVVSRVARQLGVGTESLRNRVRQAEFTGAPAPASQPKSAGG